MNSNVKTPELTNGMDLVLNKASKDFREQGKNLISQCKRKLEKTHEESMQQGVDLVKIFLRSSAGIVDNLEKTNRTAKSQRTEAISSLSALATKSSCNLLENITQIDAIKRVYEDLQIISDDE